MTSPSARKDSMLQRLCILALAAAAILTSGLSGSPSGMVSTTDALWTDAEHSSGTITSGTVPGPHLTATCRYRPGVAGLGARVEIYWSAPDGYTVEDAQIHASTSGLGSVLAPLTGFSLSGNTTGDPNGYTTTVRTNLLGGLLGLGSELEIAILISNHGWTSEPASIATNAGLIAGIGGNCRNLS